MLGVAEEPRFQSVEGEAPEDCLHWRRIIQEDLKDIGRTLDRSEATISTLVGRQKLSVGPLKPEEYAMAEGCAQRATWALERCKGLQAEGKELEAHDIVSRHCRKTSNEYAIFSVELMSLQHRAFEQLKTLYSSGLVRRQDEGASWWGLLFPFFVCAVPRTERSGSVGNRCWRSSRSPDLDVYQSNLDVYQISHSVKSEPLVRHCGCAR